MTTLLFPHCVVRIFVRILLIGVICSIVDTLHAGQPPEVKKAIIQLCRRQETIQGVYCRIRGRCTVPKATYNERTESRSGKGGDIPPTDYNYDKEVACLLDFAKNRVRKETKDEGFLVDEAIFAPLHTFRVYNGKDLNVYRPNRLNSSGVYKPSEMQPDLTIQTKRYKHAFFDPADYPVFFAAGGIPVLGKVPVPDQLRVMATESMLHFQGVAERADGRHCLVFRTPSTLQGGRITYDEFWMDQERAAAIARWVRYFDKQVLFLLEVNYKRTQDRWLPHDWTCARYFYNKPTKLTLYQRLVAEEWRINPDVNDKEFTINLERGMLVYNVNEEKYYEVGAEGQLLDTTVAQRVGKGVDQWTRAWVIIVVVALLLVSSLWWYFRSKRQWKSTE